MRKNTGKRLLLILGIIEMMVLLCACSCRDDSIGTDNGNRQNAIFHLDGATSIVLRNGNTGGGIPITDEDVAQYIYDEIETISPEEIGESYLGWMYMLEFKDDEQNNIAQIVVNGNDTMDYDGKRYSCDSAELYDKLEAYWQENAKKCLFDAEKVAKIVVQSGDGETSYSVTDAAELRSICDKIDQESLISDDAVSIYGNGRPYILTLQDEDGNEMETITVNANVELACDGRVYCCKDLGLYDYLEEY